MIVPTLLRLGSPEPFSIPIAWRISTAAGGVLVMNVNERSSKTVITTGIVVPMSSDVWALNALTNSMMLMPCWPSAGPTGGAGEAWPPGACSLMVVSTSWPLDLLHLVVADLDGVSRPKIDTSTLSLPASSLISEISPEKSDSGPEMTLTDSPIENWARLGARTATSR